MSCRNYQMVLQQVARGETVDTEARIRALTHTHACEACSSHLARSQVLTEALAALAEVNRSIETPATVEVSLQRAFRLTSQQKVPMTGRSQKAFWKAGLAVAAALVLAVSLVTWRTVHQRRNSLPAQAVRAAASSTKVGPTPARPAAKPVVRINLHPVKSSICSPEVQRRRREALQGFLPLPNADDSDGDTLAMVRIELQAGALEALGMTVPEGNNSRPVVADVLIGNDGMARAIRFDQ
ncbi:MAG TPA: hypothetical protein VMX16_08380 [Terriglobia bacterium]|nr:hypothetical protein [Terriglobia bacterium]